MKYYVIENNSAGLRVVFKAYDEYESIEAENYKEAIMVFEKWYDISWEDQNSYEGNSCNCCGRRFRLYTPNKEESDKATDIENLCLYNDKPWFVK